MKKTLTLTRKPAKPTRRVPLKTIAYAKKK